MIQEMTASCGGFFGIFGTIHPSSNSTSSSSPRMPDAIIRWYSLTVKRRTGSVGTIGGSAGGMAVGVGGSAVATDIVKAPSFTGDREPIPRLEDHPAVPTSPP